MTYGTPQGPPVSEQVFFQDQFGTFVSRSRVVLSGVTYPVNTISSVRTFKIDKGTSSLGWGIALTVFGLISISVAFNTTVIMAVIGLVLLAIGIALLHRYFQVDKDTFGLALGSAGGEARALLSKDWQYVNTVQTAINNALASRY